MNKKISLGASITLMLIVAILTFCLTMVFSGDIFDKKVNSVKERELMYEKIAEIDTIVRNKYFGTIETDTLFNGLSKGYFLGLNDKYGEYFTEEEYKNYLSEQSGDSVSIGVSTVKESSGYLKVIDVQENSPAQASGIIVGDLIISVDGTAVTKDNATQLIKSFKNKAGTSIEIIYRRDGVDTPVTIIRKQFEVKTVFSELHEKTGYIKITEFTAKTENQFKMAVDELVVKGVTGFIFDVRDNEIGTIEYVSKVIDYLLPEGNIAIAEYKDGKTEVLTKSSPSAIDLPMVVLVNKNTKSAAELFAASIKDYQKGKIIGEVTAGKGVVQEMIKLKDGSAINLTVAKLNPPKSVNYDGVGITPDFSQTLGTDQNIHDLTFETDPQIKKAREVLYSNITPEDNTISSSEGSAEVTQQVQ
ncbi:MAG: S41 family peptidase [Oscillospiraceae bacterium]